MNAAEKQKKAIRESLERYSPGTLAWLDALRNKLPASRLIGLAVKTDDGWRGLGEFAKTDGKKADGSSQ